MSNTFLDGSTYTQLRGLRWMGLSDTGHTYRGTFTDDGGGGGTASYANSSTVQCRVVPLTGGEQEAAGAISDLSTHLIMVPPGTSLVPEDRFVVDNRGTYTITAIRDRTAEWITEFEAAKL